MSDPGEAGEVRLKAEPISDQNAAVSSTNESPPRSSKKTARFTKGISIDVGSEPLQNHQASVSGWEDSKECLCKHIVLIQRLECEKNAA